MLGRRVSHGGRPAGQLHSLMTSSQEVAPWGTVGHRDVVTQCAGSMSGTEAKGEASDGRSKTNQEQSLLSALGTTLQIVPVRDNLDSIRSLMKGDCYKERGCRRRETTRSRFANPLKVAEFGREQAITLFTKYLEDDVQPRSAL